jgi:hypothetical protein
VYDCAIPDFIVPLVPAVSVVLVGLLGVVVPAVPAVDPAVLELDEGLVFRM